MKKKNFLLIIGNGFDIELGLRTKYSDFIQSPIYKRYEDELQDMFSFKTDYSIEYDTEFNIFSYFRNICKSQNWIDLEKEIGILATRKILVFVQNSERQTRLRVKSTEPMMRSFEALRMCLNEYISELDIPAKKRNYASELLKIIATEPRDNVQIVTFNYTSIDTASGLDIKVPVHHIHGKISGGKESSLILGVQDDIEIDKSYSYIIKSHSPYYHSSRIIDLLEEADEVIFFGHSLGETDYPYFSEFFQFQCKRIEPEKRKKIRIFTYNENSRLDILYQLRIMNNKQTRMFFENADFALYRTSFEQDDHEINKYFNELIKDLSVN